MAGWYHQLNGHGFEQTPGNSEGQGSLTCCSPWCHKESDMTNRLNNNNLKLSRTAMKIRKLTLVHEDNFPRLIEI